jgi:transcriptional regulator with XRE-family HTH domain
LEAVAAVPRMQSFPHSAEYGHFLTELREARLAAGLTQEALASRLSVHQTLISKAEAGTRRVDVVELRAWTRALGLSLADFVAKLEQRIEGHRRPPVMRPKP